MQVTTLICSLFCLSPDLLHLLLWRLPFFIFGDLSTCKRIWIRLRTQRLGEQEGDRNAVSGDFVMEGEGPTLAGHFLHAQDPFPRGSIEGRPPQFFVILSPGNSLLYGVNISNTDSVSNLTWQGIQDCLEGTKVILLPSPSAEQIFFVHAGEVTKIEETLSQHSSHSNDQLEYKGYLLDAASCQERLNARRSGELEVQIVLTQEKQPGQAPEQDRSLLRTRLSHTLRKLVQAFADEGMHPHAQRDAETVPAEKIQGGGGGRIPYVQDM